MTYRAPVDDIIVAMETAAGLTPGIERGHFGEVDPDLIRAVLEEAGKFASEELAPLNRIGDTNGAKLIGDKIEVDARMADAYQRWAEAGWGALPCPEAFGGQNLPTIVSTAATEIWNSANAGFALCPLLTQGVVDALAAAAPKEIQDTYLPKLVSGEWSGTMNLTEPQAGSDLAALRTRAERQPDGTYRISGTKIFISYGEHEQTKNIIHLVLARLPDAPAGTRGISLFLVPKYLLDGNGEPGERNDLRCTGLEHKLGIHASPTCVMTYGENAGAVGYLIGEENKGLAVMFIMMNAARLAVGVQGVAIAERATQQAVTFANERQQGQASGTPPGERAAIVEHPDIRRNLLTMKALTAASRAICYATAGATDVMERASEPQERERAGALVALLTPVAKAFATDMGVEAASIGIQVHGGMGFIEETGAAQYLRDARIFPIYEGTNGIQAIDLVTRKIGLAGGAVLKAYLADLGGTIADVRSANLPGFEGLDEPLGEALEALEEASTWVLGHIESETDSVLGVATPYLRLFGVAAGGVYLARNALHAARTGSGGAGSYLDLVRFFADNYALTARGLARSVMTGGAGLQNLDPATLRA